MCDEDQSWESFFVASALVGEVGGWLLMRRLLYWTFHVWRGSIMTVIFRGRRTIWWCWRVTPIAPRIVLDVSCVTRINHDSHFSWQAHYLVMLEGDSYRSAHCTGRFMCDEDQSWQSIFVAGALFGDVGGWLLSLRALYWTFHVWRGSIMRAICRGTRTRWWSWTVTPDAPLIVLDVSCVTRINHESHFGGRRTICFTCCDSQTWMS